MGAVVERNESRNCWALYVGNCDEPISRRRVIELYTSSELAELRDTLIRAIGLPDDCVRLSDES